MAKFMLLLGISENRGKKTSALTPEEVTRKYGEWTAMLAQQGRLHDAHKLFDGQGRKILWREGQVVDGPFTETKESIGGYYVIEAKDYDEAVGIARECPTVVYQGGFVEVRAVEV